MDYQISTTETTADAYTDTEATAGAYMATETTAGAYTATETTTDTEAAAKTKKMGSSATTAWTGAGLGKRSGRTYQD